MTLTAHRRYLFPDRYIKKDARRAIYRAIFDWGNSNTIPVLQRELREGFDRQGAIQTYLNWQALAQLPADTDAKIRQILKI